MGCVVLEGLSSVASKLSMSLRSRSTWHCRGEAEELFEQDEQETVAAAKPMDSKAVNSILIPQFALQLTFINVMLPYLIAAHCPFGMRPQDLFQLNTLEVKVVLD